MNNKSESTNIFQRGYLPYWCILFLDCATIVAAGMFSVYITLGGLATIHDFWPYFYIWFLSLPLFVGMMFLFRSYKGLVKKSLGENIVSILCALLLGAFILQVFGLFAPKVLIPFRPALRSTIMMVIISGAMLSFYRVIAKRLFWVNQEDGKVYAKWNPFNNVAANKKGFIIDDESLRKRINLCLAHMSEDGLEQKYVKEAFDTNWVVPLGPNVNAFEKDLEGFLADGYGEGNGEGDGKGRKVAALSAGTAAIHLALRACGVQAGDEVIVQTFTFCASANPIAYLGAIPVFVDSEPDTWNMDPELMEKAIIDRKEQTGKYPKAIVPVSLYGMPYQIDKIMAIADKYGIPVVEDAAEGLGSRYNGKVLGTFGTFGVLSFNGNKMITTSGGGALICRDEESKDNILWYATQAREAYPYYQHEAIGYNYRMSNVCAGIGRGQMTVLDDHIAHHKKVQALYRELLKGVDGVHLHEQPVRKGSNGENIYDANFWLCTITIDPEVRIKGQENAYKEVVKGAVGGAAGVLRLAQDESSVDAAMTDCQPNDNVEALRVWLDNSQIEARPLWKPMHKQPVFAGAPAYVNGVSEELFKKGMCLPSGPWVKEEDVRYIVERIKEGVVS